MDAASPRFEKRGLAWWAENGGRYCRLPSRARGTVRDAVWELAQHTAGVRVCFATDSSVVAVRVRNLHANVMPHMPATGSGGCHLYEGEPYRMRPLAVAVPDQQSSAYERTLVSGLSRRRRQFTLYLPLYNAVQELHIGLNRGARLGRIDPPALDKPVVFYGTSITQGGCAALPGSDFVASACRALNLDFVNLGFSGNGRGEPEMAALVREIDACLYVLDYVANVDERTLARTLSVFYRLLRERQPHTPVVLLPRFINWAAAYGGPARASFEATRDIVIAFYARCRQRGDANVHFIDSLGLMPPGLAAAYCDGGHPADHGFQVVAERLAPQLACLLFGRG